MSKSTSMNTAAYAQGGPVIGKVSQFMKTPDRFRGAQVDPNTFGKGGDGQASGQKNPKVKLPKGK